MQALAMEHREVPATTRRLRIVVAGEFGSGKSSVINAILRQQVLPANTGVLERPVIAVTHGPQLSISYIDAEGRSVRLNDAHELKSVRGAHRIDIVAPMPSLAGVELVELPFYHDGEVDGPVLDVMARADLLIWVTIASQAWRLSEKSIVEMLPREGRANRVLAISRSDKLRSFGDWDKIETRLQKESAGYFSEIVFMRASNAILAQSGDSTEAWQRSGGQAVVRMIRDRFGDLVDGLVEDTADPQPIPEAIAAPPVASAPEPQPEPVAAPSNVIEFHPIADAVPDRFAEPAPEPEPASPKEELERIFESLAGLTAAGIGSVADGIERIFTDHAGMAEQVGLGSAAVLAAHARGAALMPGTEPIEEILSTIGKHVILVRPLGTSGRFLFIVLQRDRTSPAIARVVAQRAAMLMEQVG